MTEKLLQLFSFFVCEVSSPVSDNCGFVCKRLTTGVTSERLLFLCGGVCVCPEIVSVRMPFHTRHI